LNDAVEFFLTAFEQLSLIAALKGIVAHQSIIMAQGIKSGRSWAALKAKIF
jgi:hypothetical protein